MIARHYPIPKPNCLHSGIKLNTCDTRNVFECFYFEFTCYDTAHCSTRTWHGHSRRQMSTMLNNLSSRRSESIQIRYCLKLIWSLWVLSRPTSSSVSTTVYCGMAMITGVYAYECVHNNFDTHTTLHKTAQQDTNVCTSLWPIPCHESETECNAHDTHTQGRKQKEREERETPACLAWWYDLWSFFSNAAVMHCAAVLPCHEYSVRYRRWTVFVSVWSC